VFIADFIAAHPTLNNPNNRYILLKKMSRILARMRELINDYTILVGKHDGKTPLGPLRR
jgi:hypothetical protein